MTAVWENDTITRTEAAKLTVTVPGNVVSVKVGGEEVTLFTLTEEETKVFTYTTTPEEAGRYQYTVVLEEAHGYTFDAGLTPVLTVKEPVPAAEDPADPADPADPSDPAGDNGAGEGRRCAFKDLLQAILNFFRRVINMFKVKTC